MTAATVTPQFAYPTRPICDDENARLGVLFQNPLGKQDHHNALATPFGCANHAPFAFGNPHLRGLDPKELMGPGAFLLPGIRR